MNPFYNLSIEHASPTEISEDTFLSFVSALFPFHREASYSLVKVKLSLIRPLTKYVFKHRLTKSRKLIGKYDSSRIDLFKPLLFNFSNSYIQLVGPPVLELRSDEFVLCDGTHRVFSAMRDDIESVYCLVVRGVTIPLPGEIGSWDKVQILENQVPIEENFINYNPRYFTGYTSIFNNEKVWLKYNPDLNAVLAEISLKCSSFKLS